MSLEFTFDNYFSFFSFFFFVAWCTEKLIMHVQSKNSQKLKKVAGGRRRNRIILTSATPHAVNPKKPLPNPPCMRSQSVEPHARERAVEWHRI